MAILPFPRRVMSSGLVLLWSCTGLASAQSSDVPGTVLPTVTVSGQAPAPMAVGGWLDVPAAASPLAGRVIDAATLREANVQRLADITRLDASASSAYDAVGYWDGFSVRGYVLDNRLNLRRDGLPISGETSIPLDNKARVEMLKGTSGVQAGTSSPAGLVNVVVARPTARPHRSLRLGWTQNASWLGAVDVSERWGIDGEAGLRVIAAAEHFDPIVRRAEGRRHLLSAAGEWRLSGGTLVEVEGETSRRSQPSVPGFSLLGDALPNAASVDPRINLNNQPWTQPVVLAARTASLRVTHSLSSDWRAVVHAGTQHLRNDDRTAFPYGLYAADYSCDPCDRFSSDGRFSVWEFISDDERRRTDAVDLSLHGRAQLGGLDHDLTVGVQWSRHRARFQQQVFDLAGTGTIDGTAVVPRSGGFLDENTQRREANRALYLRDTVALGERTRAWLGLRHTAIERDAVRTDGTGATHYSQSFTTPWAALSVDLDDRTMVYASAGHGIESDLTPNRARYTNAGRPLPVARSRQTEFGAKHDGPSLGWALTLFDIARPVAADIGVECASDTPGATCTRQRDGEQRHRGAEVDLALQQGPWRVQANAMWLHARRRGSIDASTNGLQPVNVPRRAVKLIGSYAWAGVPGLTVHAAAVHEGDRMVLADNSVRAPGWTRIDAGMAYSHSLGGRPVMWRAGVENVFDRRAWRETPTQYGHVYLFPLAPRTWNASLRVDL